MKARTASSRGWRAGEKREKSQQHRCQARRRDQVGNEEGGGGGTGRERIAGGEESVGASPENVERVYIPEREMRGKGSAKEEKERKKRTRGKATESEIDLFFSILKSCPFDPVA
jgi:hypothetical protein